MEVKRWNIKTRKEKFCLLGGVSSQTRVDFVKQMCLIPSTHCSNRFQTPVLPAKETRSGLRFGSGDQLRWLGLELGPG